MKKHLFILFGFIITSACTPGVYKVNNSTSGRAIFVAECTGSSYTSCQRRAAQKCPKGYFTLKRYSEVKTVSQPVYRTAYRTRYHSVYHRGHRHYRPYRQAYTYVVGHKYHNVRMRYLRFSCR